MAPQCSRAAHSAARLILQHQPFRLQTLQIPLVPARMRAEIGDVHGWPVRTFFEIRRRPGDMLRHVRCTCVPVEDHTYINVHRGNCPFWCQVPRPLDASSYGPLDASENRVANYSNPTSTSRNHTHDSDVMLHAPATATGQLSGNRIAQRPRSPAPRWGQQPNIERTSCVL